MTILNHTLGFSRAGLRRELKKTQESYWAGNSTREELLAVGRELHACHWDQQRQADIDLLPVDNFAWYDHVLTVSLLLGSVPQHYQNNDGSINIGTLFRVDRGCVPIDKPAATMGMTKWSNTNCHYMAPEFVKGQQFKLTWAQLLEEMDEALALGHKVKPVLLGPITYLWPGKVKSEQFDRLSLLNDILPVYQRVLVELAKRGIERIQIDEPALVLELPQAWLNVYKLAYGALRGQVKLLLTICSKGVTPNLDTITTLPVQGLHVDLMHGKDDVAELHERLPSDWLLSAGLINGHNVWRADLTEKYAQIKGIVGKRDLWVASSCSLLHSPVNLSMETRLDAEVKSWLALALQECRELALLRDALNGGDAAALAKRSALIQACRHSTRVHNPAVEKRLAAITTQDSQRANVYGVYAEAQCARFKLPVWSATTIGSFPQTTEIRTLRLDFKKGNLDTNNYRTDVAKHIKQTIVEQKRLGLDMLIHGGAERNDVVRYFSERLDGFVFTQNGWVWSYGSRCVKPPIVIGDVSHPAPITVEWAKYTQSLTDKPVRGMLTGPVTTLCWLFPHEDVSRETIAKQIALALRDEVADLEAAGIGAIQVDEPALRKGLPLRRSDWDAYLQWGAGAFRINATVVKDDTQIHVRICYCGFNGIMDPITALDADVITIETSRSDMELLESFGEFDYPNEIDPGVYDIHSPSVLSVGWVETLLRKATKRIPAERLWVNPDCGLKMRGWPETCAALANMVQAAQSSRRG